MSMGTQYRFSIDDTNRDGAPVPDVFVVGDKGLTANEFLGHLRRTSNDFAEAYNHSILTARNVGVSLGKDEIYKAIVQWWNERGRNPNDSVATLIDEWQLSTQRTFTATVTFQGVEEPLVITNIEADDEDDAKAAVEDGISARMELEYSGPGDIDSDPFDTPYIDYIEIEEEEE